MAVRGDLGTLRRVRKAITRELPLSVAHATSKRASIELTRMTRQAFSSGQTVYGESRKIGRGGRTLALRRTGKVAGGIGIKRVGTQLWATLPTPYTKFLVGKYKILPNNELPISWQKAIKRIAGEEVRGKFEVLLRAA